MHREIMIRADPRPEAFMAAHPVDHGNWQTLDNRRSNLRWVTRAENAANTGPRGKIPSLDDIVAQLMREHPSTRQRCRLTMERRAMEVQSSAALQMHFPRVVAIRCCTGCQQGRPPHHRVLLLPQGEPCGFDTRCRDCRNERRRIWRAANRDRINARRRELYALRKASVSDENNKNQAATHDSKSAHDDSEETSGNAINGTHDTPLGLTADVADQFIKDFGIPEAALGSDPDQNVTTPIDAVSEISDEETGGRQAGAAIAVGETVEWSIVRDPRKFIAVNNTIRCTRALRRHRR
jgi:hypothetical protein